MAAQTPKASPMPSTSRPNCCAKTLPSALRKTSITSGRIFHRSRLHHDASRRLAWNGFGPAQDPCHQSGIGAKNRHERSEEHTSELQSLMRISYAVFCLKKKKKKTTHSLIVHPMSHT